MQNTVNTAITSTPGAVREACQGHATVLAALESLHLLDGLTGEQSGEVHWVLAQLSVDHDNTVRTTIAGAIGAGQTAVVEWAETEVVNVAVEDIPGGKKVTLQTPFPPGPKGSHP
jgi:hypothetical protein